jgi:hypothetical protein
VRQKADVLGSEEFREKGVSPAPRRSITLFASLAYRIFPFQTESKHSATKHLKALICGKGARDLGYILYAVAPFVT